MYGVSPVSNLSNNFFTIKMYHMKNNLFLIAIASMFIVSFQSYKKDAPDLTTSIVGTYVGVLADTVPTSGQTAIDCGTIIVQKVVNSNIQIGNPTSCGGNYGVPFTASIITNSSGTLELQVQSQSVNGVTVTGGSLSGYPSNICGVYSLYTLQYQIVVPANGGGVAYESFLGIKQ